MPWQSSMNSSVETLWKVGSKSGVYQRNEDKFQKILFKVYEA